MFTPDQSGALGKRTWIVTGNIVSQNCHISIFNVKQPCVAHRTGATKISLAPCPLPIWLADAPQPTAAPERANIHRARGKARFRRAASHGPIDFAFDHCRRRLRLRLADRPNDLVLAVTPFLTMERSICAIHQTPLLRNEIAWLYEVVDEQERGKHDNRNLIRKALPPIEREHKRTPELEALLQRARRAINH